MKLTDKRTGVIDRYYIRIYDAYLRKKDPARFAACLYVGLTIGLILSPIPIFVRNYSVRKEGISML